MVREVGSGKRGVVSEMVITVGLFFCLHDLAIFLETGRKGGSNIGVIEVSMQALY